MRALVWFRSDLRVRDNTALHTAARQSDDMAAVFLVSSDQWREHDWGPAKIDFVLRNATELGRSLSELGIPLHIRVAPRFADAPRVLAEVLRAEGGDALFYNREYEVNERERDDRVAAEMARSGALVRAFDDQTVVPPDQLRTGGGGFYRVFTPFKRAWLHELGRRGEPRTAPPPEPGRPAAFEMPDSHGPSSPVPTSTWPAGEREALRRLDRFVLERIERYEVERDFPAIDATSTLSPYLACGVISPRQCLAAIADAHEGAIDAAGPGATSWISELAWREFYRHVLVGYPRVCRGRAFKSATDTLAWCKGGEAFRAWSDGRTGVPIIDAAMRQLARTGWMHNRLRMIVAMYLTKDLFVDWREGERFFMRQLVDGDFANNNGGWQWSASTGTDAAPYFRVFNPTSQSRRYDPRGEFIRTWCPELRRLDDRSIHDPASLSAERRSGLDYPAPLVDHAEARRRTLAEWGRISRANSSRSRATSEKKHT